ncbi:MAG: hypothetical protein R6U98_18870 [Pirellulaceae bacterium]
MKPIATKSNEGYVLEVPGTGRILFADPPPEDEYTWGGYVSNEDEFVRANFSTCFLSGVELQMCSAKNAIALLEYITEYVLECEDLGELFDCLFEGMAYWFYYGYEYGETEFSWMPEWGQDIIELGVERGEIIRTAMVIDESDYDLFIFKKAGVLKPIENEVCAIISNALAECEGRT